MEILMQFRTNVNYMAYISYCLIGICKTHTINFGYQTYFISQFTFKLHLAWNAFDCLLWVKGPGVMMVNAAFIEQKMLHYTILSLKLHHCTLSESKTQVFTLSDILACLSIHCADQKQHSNLGFSTKSVISTFPTSVEIANEYLQVNNIRIGVKNQFFCKLHQCNCGGYTKFLFAFVLSN